uniref:Uncharacterized protein n=1 Tax=Anguilla anguilla TaxID=7936 RepID=A0A0E9UKP3_ANGAN
MGCFIFSFQLSLAVTFSIAL